MDDGDGVNGDAIAKEGFVVQTLTVRILLFMMVVVLRMLTRLKGAFYLKL